MRFPRDITGAQLATKLKLLGYEITRQTGSHIRMTTQQKGEHHVTVPNHETLRIGTASAILGDIAEHFGVSKETLVSTLFEK